MQPAQRADPGRARERHRRSCSPRPQGGLVSGQSALLRLGGLDPGRAHGEARRWRCTWSIRPGARPSALARLFEDPELKTFEERQKDRAAEPGEGAAAAGQPARGRARPTGQRAAAKARQAPADAGPARWRRWAPVARGRGAGGHARGRGGRHPRRRAASRREHGLKLIVAGRPRGLARAPTC